MVGCLRHWGRAEHCNSWSLFPRRVTTSWWEGNKNVRERQGVLHVPLSRVLLGRQHACFLYFGSYLLQFPVSPRSLFSIQLQIHWWAYSSHDPGISEKCYTNPNYNRAFCHVFKYFSKWSWCSSIVPVLYLLWRKLEIYFWCHFFRLLFFYQPLLYLW